MESSQTVSRQRKATRSIWDHDYLHMHPLLESIRRHTDVIQGQVLDVGCGHQPYRDWFNRADLIIGVDVDQEDSSPNVIASASSLPFRDASFDAVISFQALEHIPEPEKTWNEIARILRHDGIALITTHQSFRVHEEPHDYFRYTRYGLHTMASNAGLEVLTIEAHGGVCALAGQALLSSFMSRMPGYVYPVLGPLIIIWNLLFGLLEKMWHDERDTMNHLVISRK